MVVPSASGPWVLVGLRFSESTHSGRQWLPPCECQSQPSIEQCRNVHVLLCLPGPVLGVIVTFPFDVKLEDALVLSVFACGKELVFARTFWNLWP